MCTGKNQDQNDMLRILATKAPILKLVAEERQNRILDANYEVIDLEAKVNTTDSLSEHQKKQLFSGGIGTTNIELIHLEIKEGAKQKHLEAYPIANGLKN